MILSKAGEKKTKKVKKTAHCMICGKAMERECFPPSEQGKDAGKPYEHQVCGQEECMSAAWKITVQNFKERINYGYLMYLRRRKGQRRE